MKNNTDTNQYIYHTQGVCPPEIHFKINDGRIKDIRFVGGGCPGNAELVSRLLEGKSLTQVLPHLEGIDCRNDTSCPEELAVAIQAAQNGILAASESFRVQEDSTPRRSVALIGNLAGDNAVLENILEHIQDYDVESVLCLGNLVDDSALNRNLIKTIRRKKIPALQGETDWQYSQRREKSDKPNLDPRLVDWLLQLPQVQSFKLNSRKCMAFYGDYIQSLADYSDFAPFALEMNMVCGLTDFMRDETVFPALEAMTPQFQSDVIIFSQIKTWGVWRVGGKDFISVGGASDSAGLTWGLLTESNGKAELKIMQVTL